MHHVQLGDYFAKQNEFTRNILHTNMYLKASTGIKSSSRSLRPHGVEDHEVETFSDLTIYLIQTDILLTCGLDWAVFNSQSLCHFQPKMLFPDLVNGDLLFFVGKLCVRT